MWWKNKNKIEILEKKLKVKHEQLKNLSELFHLNSKRIKKLEEEVLKLRLKIDKKN